MITLWSQSLTTNRMMPDAGIGMPVWASTAARMASVSASDMVTLPSFIALVETPLALMSGRRPVQLKVTKRREVWSLLPRRSASTWYLVLLLIGLSGWLRLEAGIQDAPGALYSGRDDSVPDEAELVDAGFGEHGITLHHP